MSADQVLSLERGEPGSAFDRVAGQLQVLVSSRLFQRLVIGVILFSAVLLGLETSRELVERIGPQLKALDRLILGFFVFEIALRILSHGRTPKRYFADAWNMIDLVIVGVCLIPASSSAVAIFRMIRVLRVLRLVTALPKLQLIISALFRSIPSMGYVVALLSIHLYMFGVLGTFLFRDNDPVNFGTLGATFLSLFQILTLEGWADLMKIQMYGCQVFGYESMPNLCTQPQTHPWVAPIYFVSFIVLGTMIILNLLIGVVVNGMSDASHARDSAPEEPTLGALLEEVRELRRAVERRQD